MQKPSNFIHWIRRRPRWHWAALGLIVLGVAGVFWLRGRGSGQSVPAFAARRGPLEITILEGGSLQALESQEVKCEVRVGYQGTKILKIVEEGYQVTEEDITNHKVLVELDSSELQKQIVQQEITFQSAVASLIDAQQNYEIQLNQNQSDIKAAEQKTRFARMDFDKFLGDSVTEKIIARVGLDAMLAAAGTNDVEHTARAEAAFAEAGATPSAGPPAGVSAEVRRAASAGEGIPAMLLTNAVARPAASRTAGVAAKAGPAGETAGAPMDTIETGAGLNLPAIVVDFSAYASLEALGDGEARQKLRKFEDDLQVAQKELGQAKMTLEGTQRLHGKGFVTKTDLQRDEIAYDNNRLRVQTAESARDLFLKYDFLKSAEEALSKYAEAVREFDKARRVAISKAAQAKARLKSAEGQYQVQTRQRNDLNEQLAKCTIEAKRAGLVVYGGARDDAVFYGGEERIREGASVRERQAIITIPDMSRMAVNVKIHESYIKKVKKGQKARITVDAFPDTVLTGEVTKVGVLPDSQNRWMNPDMKVYLTTIAIDGTQDWAKPGMSAKVEILVNRIADCVYVPVQAVVPEGGKQVCHLAGGLRRGGRQEVAIGDFNDEFIEIKSGLKEGDRVLLQVPEAAASEISSSGKKPAETPATEAPAPREKK